MDLEKILKDSFKQKEVNLADNYLNILNNSHDIIIYQDLKHRIIWANKTAMKMAIKTLSCSPQQIIGKYCYKLFQGKEQVCEKCAVSKAAQSEKVEEMEKINPNGNKYLVRAYPIKNKNDEIVGFFKSSLNITEHEVLKERLEQNKLKNKFFANLSHEFKTPLNLTFSSLQVLESRLKNEGLIENYQRYTNIIKQNSNRLLKLINNLIDITKLNAGSYELKLENYDIVSLVEKIIYSIKDYAQFKKRELIFNTQLTEKIIACDPFNMERVILNLISNAIKFTNSEDQIKINIYSEPDKVLISVQDAGIGIPEDKQKIIFEQFGQANKSFNRNNEGSGIGLSLTKSIIEMHQGHIHLESKYQQGSKFIIELPDRRLEKEFNKEKTNKSQDQFLSKMEIEFSDIYF